MSDRGRIAVVTGGIQGLGAATARRLDHAGFNVAATHYGGGDTASKFADETGFPVYEWDVSDFAACEQAMAEIRETHGPVDVLVNNAGVNRDAMFHKMSRDDWDAVLRVDLGSMFNVTRQVIGGMRERGYGRIVNISSVNAQKGQVGQTNYCAAKAGIIGFTKALARESAGKGITVNAVAPGYANTPMVAKLPENILERIVGSVPVGRLAEPQEIARCVAFLASEEAGFITGATLSVNGGLYM
ncbi:MAG: acetoacetyl-CoA reductase [Dichotomicrobium sp.]